MSGSISESMDEMELNEETDTVEIENKKSMKSNFANLRDSIKKKMKKDKNKKEEKKEKKVKLSFKLSFRE